MSAATASESAAELATLPALEIVFYDTGGGSFISSPMRGFGHRSFVTGDRESWISADNAADEYRVWSPSGELRMIVRRGRPVRSVTDADREAFLASASPTTESGALATRASARVADTFPFFGDLRIDAEGFVWIEDIREAGTEEVRWSVFDRDGVRVATVDMPTGTEVLTIYADQIIGVQRDSLDVEVVSVHALHRQ